MKIIKKVVPIVLVVAIIAAAVIMIHPVRVYTSTSYSYKVLFTGEKTKLDGIEETSAGYKCYLDDTHWVLFSYDSIECKFTGKGLYLRYNVPWRQPTLIR